MPRVFVPRRLDKYLRDSTSLSVVEIRQACRSNRIALSSACAETAENELEQTLVFEDDTVKLDGARVEPRTAHQYLVLNKPRFITATARDPDGRTDLGPWLRAMPVGVFPIGRLDRETSGMLLFTNDGDFANAILQPDHHARKLYWLWIDGPLDADDPRLAAFLTGVQFDASAEPLRAKDVTVVNRTLDYTELHVTLEEGKNRQIRKMCNYSRLELLELHRKAIGSLTPEDLAIGSWRHLHRDEVDGLWQSCGGKERVLLTKILALRKLALLARSRSGPNARLEAWLQNVGITGSASP